MELDEQSRDGWGHTEPTPSNLPMSFPFMKTHYFVRECYPLYFNEIISGKLTHAQYVTVTGTPGIGKSAFFMYFAHRFLRDYPDRAVVTASFGSQRTFQKCVTFDAGARDGREHLSIPDIDDALYLFDGPPSRKPSNGQMICFCCPNTAWLTEAASTKGHVRIYLPCWGMEELLLANHVMPSKISEGDIRSRFTIFGGVARVCFATKKWFVELMKKELIAKAHGIRSCAELRSHLEGESIAMEGMSHSVFHLEPRDSKKGGFASAYSTQFASEVVAETVVGNVIANCHDDVVDLMTILRRSPAGSTLIGNVFEVHAGSHLIKPGSHSLKLLSPSAEHRILHLPQGGFQPAQWKNCESLDGSYMDGSSKTLYVFQMTVAATHPIKAKGILQEMERRDCPPDTEVVIVFVVPSFISEFRLQKIELPAVHLGYDANVSQLPNVGKKRVAKLAARGIHSVAHLVYEMGIDPGLCRSFDRNLRLFDELIGKRDVLARISESKQFLLKLSV